MKQTQIVVALFIIMLCPALASAQARVDAFFGLGTAKDGATTTDIFSPGTPFTTSSMGGVFGAFGGDFMLKPSLGVGAQVSLRFAQGDYQPGLGVGYRPIFYDFNGIWTPSFGTKRMMPEIQAGFGGMSMKFYAGPQVCNYYSCSNSIGSSNHFQLHGSFGFRIYVKEHVFVRPQFDYHWVHGLNQDLKSDSVMAYTVALGYSFQ